MDSGHIHATNGAIQVQTQPQIVTVLVDPLAIAAITDLRAQIGLLFAEQQLTRQAIEKLLTLAQDEAATRIALDKYQLGLAQALGADFGAYVDAPMERVEAPTSAVSSAGVSDSIAAPETPQNAPESVTALSPEQAEIVSPDTVRARLTPEQLYKQIENDWYVDDAGAYMIRQRESAEPRPATAAEKRAIDADIAKGGRRGRRR